MQAGTPTSPAAAGEGNTRLTLIIGDDTFTFTPGFLESRHYIPGELVEVASCLPEDKIPDDFRPNYLALTAQRVVVHFGINPAQLRNHFFNNQYSRVIVVLPGIAFTGFPAFIDRQHSPLFKLRIHMFAFGFLKSTKNALRPDAVIQFVWPRQNDRGELPPSVPWHAIDIGKIGPFCEIYRSELDDEALDTAAFQDWRPLIHNEPMTMLPPYLNDCVLYSWRLSPPPGEAESKPPTGEDKDGNLLFVPPEIWNHSADILPHVNELLKFEMQTHDGGFMVVSKPTLKFDPRFRSDGGPAKNPFAKRGGLSGGRGTGRFFRAPCHESMGPMMHPPPPPPDIPPEAALMAGYGGHVGAEVDFRGPMGGLVPRWYEPLDPVAAERMRMEEALGNVPGAGPMGFRYPYGHLAGLRTKRGRPMDGERFLGDIERHQELGLPFEMEQMMPGKSMYHPDDVGYPPDGQQHDDVLLYERMELGLPFDCHHPIGVGRSGNMRGAGPSFLCPEELAMLREQRYLSNMGPGNSAMVDADAVDMYYEPPLMESRTHHMMGSGGYGGPRQPRGSSRRDGDGHPQPLDALPLEEQQQQQVPYEARAPLTGGGAGSAMPPPVTAPNERKRSASSSSDRRRSQRGACDQEISRGGGSPPPPLSGPPPPLPTRDLRSSRELHHAPPSMMGGSGGPEGRRRRSFTPPQFSQNKSGVLHESRGPPPPRRPLRSRSPPQERRRHRSPWDSRLDRPRARSPLRRAPPRDLRERACLLNDGYHHGNGGGRPSRGEYLGNTTSSRYGGNDPRYGGAACPPPPLLQRDGRLSARGRDADRSRSREVLPRRSPSPSRMSRSFSPLPPQRFPMRTSRP